MRANSLSDLWFFTALSRRTKFLGVSPITISFPSDVYPEVGLLDHGVVLFSVFEGWGELHTALHCGLHQFTFPPRERKNFLPPVPCQHLISLVFLMTAILTVMRQYLIGVLICVPLMANDVKYLFMCLLSICMFSSAKCLLRCSAHF